MARLRSLPDRVRRLFVPLILAALAAVAILTDADPAGASPLRFVIEFTQFSAPASADGPPTGHFSIDDSLLDTGSDQFIHLTTISDFEVADDGAVFPAPLWFGYLHIPAFGDDSLDLRGLPGPASNAIAELLLGSNDPRCLGVAVGVPTHCEAAIGAGSNGTLWSLVLFDPNNNLAVAQGVYSIVSVPVPEPGTISMLGIGMLVLIRMRPWRRGSLI